MKKKREKGGIFAHSRFVCVFLVEKKRQKKHPPLQINPTRTKKNDMKP